MRGRAEAIRLTLHAQGVEFQDDRIVSPEEWAEIKARTPFGRLPVFRTDSLEICESHAILRHLARAFGWVGRSEAQDALIDITQEVLTEAQEDLWRFAWVKDYQEKMNAYAAKTLEPTLGRLENWMCRDGGAAEYWIGGEPIHVDFLAFAYLDEVDAFFPDLLESYSNLSGFRSRMEEIPLVQRYLTSGDRPFVFGIGRNGPKVDRRQVIPEGSKFENPWHQPIALA